ncbi:FtsX-like permease family protein [bacterium]|nr:FtsX-like permease family protein [bacterium]
MLTKMALRNLRRNSRRTIITLASIAFGIMLALTFTGIGDSSYTRLINSAARLGMGHVTILHRDYLLSPSLSKTIQPASQLKTLLEKDSNIEYAVVRITGQVMVVIVWESVGAAFMALDPDNESAETNLLLDHIVSGEIFAADDKRGLIIGAKMAENLDVEIGDKVIYTCSDRHGEIVSGLGRVRGIYKTGADQVDKFMVLLPIERVRKLLGYESDEATMVVGFCRDVNRARLTQYRTRKNLSINDSIADSIPAIELWTKTAPDMAGLVQMDRTMNYLFQIIVFILIAAGILNTILMSVFERTREFGVMMAIGMSPGNLFRLILTEAFWLSLFGIISGLIITSPLYLWLHYSGWDVTKYFGEIDVAGVIYDPTIYNDLRLESFLVILTISFGISMLSGLYPAWRAGRVAPVESLKHIG